MIKLEKAITFARLNNLMTLIKAYVDGAVSALASSVSGIMEDVNSSIDALERGILQFENKTVAVAAWKSDSTYSDYPYRAAITCTGVTAEHVPDVVFAASDMGKTCPFAQTGAGVVYIYAKEIPADTITIPVIECRKAVS